MTTVSEEERLARAVLRLNGTILGLVLGIISGLIIFVGTNWLVLKGGREVGPHLALDTQGCITMLNPFGYRLLGSLAEARDAARTVAVGKVDAQTARLLDGSRVNVAVRPIGVDGPLVSVYGLRPEAVSYNASSHVGTLTPSAARPARIAGWAARPALFEGRVQPPSPGPGWRATPAWRRKCSTPRRCSGTRGTRACVPRWSACSRGSLPPCRSRRTATPSSSSVRRASATAAYPHRYRSVSVFRSSASTKTS